MIIQEQDLLNKTVSPQAENGHIDVANEIAEALYKLHLTGNQWRILWVILRQTWGWHRKSDQISITFFEMKTGLKRRHIHRSLKVLIERNIVTKNGNTLIISYGFNKHYNNWKLLPKMVPITKKCIKLLPKMVPTKESIQKKKEIYKERLHNPFKDSETQEEWYKKMTLLHPCEKINTGYA
ncbi:MAG TPA: hypothetical protein ENH82_01785 [bacterium]|nr:hypothetical protein [bacterium]